MKKFFYFLLVTFCLIFAFSCKQKGKNLKDDRVGKTLIKEKKDSFPQVFTIVGTGDILLGMNWPEYAKCLPPNDGLHLFDSVSFIISRADFAFGNLEGVLLDSGGTPKPAPPPPTPCYRFRMPEKYAQLLVNAGYDAVSVANNHVMDFGADARQHTLNVLDSIGLQHAGSFSQRYTIFERNGVKYGLCAFSANAACVSLFDEVGAQKLIREVKPQCDILVVSIHAGNEGVHYRHIPFHSEYGMADPVGDVHHFAHACIDAGADIIFGHGPHVSRAVELYNDRIIAYSLGNFCTPYGMNLGSSCGVAPLLEVHVDREGKFLDGIIHPVSQGWGRGPILDPQRRAIKEIQELSSADFPDSPLHIANDGCISKK